MDETDPTTNASDAELMRQAGTGDSQALATVWERHRRRLKAMARTRLDPRVQARVDLSDVLQEAFLAAHRQLAAYPHGSMPAFLWFRRLLGQTLVDLHRHHLGAKKRDAKREISLYRGGAPNATSAALAAQLMGTITSASRAAMRDEMKLQVQEALNAMPTLDREVLAMRHFEGLNNAEVATVLEISENAASNRYVRALRRLKDFLSAILADSDIANI